MFSNFTQSDKSRRMRWLILVSWILRLPRMYSGQIINFEGFIANVDNTLHKKTTMLNTPFFAR